MSNDKTPRIIKSTYYSNWADIFGYPLAFIIMNQLKKISFITPNMVTLFSFGLFVFGSASLFLNYPYHLILAAFLIVSGYIGDDIDGQLARATGKSSNIGDFLDKALDILKIFTINASLAYAVYLQTGNILYIFLGFISAFFFMFRYYIKLEAMFSRITKDEKYLEKSSQRQNEKEAELYEYLSKLKQTIPGKVQAVLVRNRTILLADEAEFAVFTGIFAIINRLDLALWYFAISQVTIGFFRFYERGNQINSNSSKLFWPLRK